MADNEKINAVKERLLRERNITEEEKIRRIESKFENLNSFKTVDDIPSIPIVSSPEFYQNVIVRNLIRCGAIPKKDLVIGKTYIGNCRNSNEATWNGHCFEYKRFKYMTWLDDKINHFEDDNGNDLFIPIALKEN